MTESERIILDKLNLMEEAMKMLLVNDVLKDAQMVTGDASASSRQQEKLEQKIAELQNMLQARDTRINGLLNQIESQKIRIQNLQELCDSKDRTIKSKDERIQLQQKNIQELENQTANSKTANTSTNKANYAHSNNSSQKKVPNYIIGQKVKIISSCTYCYNDDYQRTRKQLPLYNAPSYVYTILEIINEYYGSVLRRLYLLYTKNEYGQEFRFWLDGDMIQPL